MPQVTAYRRHLFLPGDGAARIFAFPGEGRWQIPMGNLTDESFFVTIPFRDIFYIEISVGSRCVMLYSNAAAITTRIRRRCLWHLLSCAYKNIITTIIKTETNLTSCAHFPVVLFLPPFIHIYSRFILTFMHVYDIIWAQTGNKSSTIPYQERSTPCF